MNNVGRWIDSIKLNTIAAVSREGCPFWLKRRLPASHLLIPCANAFFRAVGNPVEVLSRRDEWQAWEVGSFHLLHGAEGFRAFAEGDDAICAEQLPGVSLEELAARNALHPPVLAAIARELRRAHGLPCARFGSGGDNGWSHADPHIGNFLFEAGTGRARLIDFDAAHHPRLSATERHADDLLVVVQCLMYYFASGPWLDAATRFLHAYFNAEPEETPALIAALRRRLAPPTGLARLWWAIRIGYIPAAECRQRLAALQQWLASPGVPDAARA